jgi:hypothetical protein
MLMHPMSPISVVKNGISVVVHKGRKHARHALGKEWKVLVHTSSEGTIVPRARENRKEARPCMRWDRCQRERPRCSGDVSKNMSIKHAQSQGTVR